MKKRNFSLEEMRFFIKQILRVVRKLNKRLFNRKTVNQVSLEPFKCNPLTKTIFK